MKKKVAIVLSWILALGLTGTVSAESAAQESAAEPISVIAEISGDALSSEYPEMPEEELLGDAGSAEEMLWEESIPEEKTDDGTEEDSGDLLSDGLEKAGDGMMDSPVSYTLGKSQSGGFTHDGSDFYGFTISEDSTVTFDASAGLDSCSFTFYRKLEYSEVKYGEIVTLSCSFDSLLWEMYQESGHVSGTLNLCPGDYVLKVTGEVFAVSEPYGPDNRYNFRLSASKYSQKTNQARLTYFKWYSGILYEADMKSAYNGNIAEGHCFPMEVPYAANLRLGVYCEGDGLDEDGAARIRLIDSNGKVRMNEWKSADGMNETSWFPVNLPAGNYRLEIRNGDTGLYRNEDRRTTSARYHFYTQITYPTSIYKLADEGSGSLRVYWSTRGVYADGYQIRWSKDKTFGTGVKSASYSKVNNVTRYGLDTGSTYYVQVRTWRDRKWHETDTYKQRFYSEWSGTKSIKLTKTLKGTSFGTCTIDKKGTIRSSWKKISGVEGYQLRYADNPGMTNAKTASTKKTSFSKSGFSTGKTWYVSIRSYKTGSDGARYYSAWSSPIKAKKV